MPVAVEEWRSVVGWEGVYEVSNLGRVRNIKSRRGTHPLLVLKPRISKCGYAKVILRDSPRFRAYMIHRLVYEAFVGAIPEGYEIDHLDSDKLNNVPANLEAVTKLENMQRAHRMPRNTARGCRQGRAVFTDEIVKQIRLRVELGEKQNLIASEFGVTPTAINCIVKRKTWRHV